MLTFFGQGNYQDCSRSNAWVYFCPKGSQQIILVYVWGQAPSDRGASASKPKPSVKLLFPLMVVLLFLGDDAVEAVKHGLDGILVSNHGARQLDGVPATVSCGIWGGFPLEFSFASQFWLSLCLPLLCEYFCVNAQGDIYMNMYVRSWILSLVAHSYLN